MNQTRESSFGLPQSRETDALSALDEGRHYPTPGEVISQIGRVIAVCLGLGLLARIIVTLTGAS